MTFRFIEMSAQKLGLSRSDIIRIVRNAPIRYKVYSIPKKSGGERIIAHPARELKDLQYILMRELLTKLPVHDAAKAYRKGRSIKDNALAHAGSSPLLKLDITDFFGSISADDFTRHCKACEISLSDDDAYFCKQVLFRRTNGALRLSIGAPSSPMVSNSIVFRMDERISSLAEKTGTAYSRYADDLTFSNPDMSALAEIRAEIPRLLAALQYPTLYVNHEKTVLISTKHRRTVTGIVLANSGEISVGRENKRNLRAAIHAYTLGKLSVEDVSVLRGRLAFYNNIEPQLLRRLERKYGAETMRFLFTAKPSQEPE